VAASSTRRRRAGGRSAGGYITLALDSIVTTAGSIALRAKRWRQRRGDIRADLASGH
jgi:hypothetical protein